MSVTVLVADPDKDILDIYSYRLRKAGYQVDLVTTGEEVLERVRVERPALLILAGNLGGVLDGFETVRKIREQEATAHLPVVIATSRDRTDDVNRGYEVGADFYFIKPVELDRLVRLVQSLIQPTSDSAATEGSSR